jgi:hypothetical protein
MGREIVLRIKRPRDTDAVPELVIPLPNAKRARTEQDAAPLFRFKLLHTLGRLPDNVEVCQELLCGIQDRRSCQQPQQPQALASDDVKMTAESEEMPAPESSNVVLMPMAHFPAPGVENAGIGIPDTMRQCFRVVDAVRVHHPAKCNDERPTQQTSDARPTLQTSDDDVYDIYFCNREEVAPRSGAQGAWVMESFSCHWNKEYDDSSTSESQSEDHFSSDDEECRQMVLQMELGGASDSDGEDFLEYDKGDDKRDCAWYAYDEQDSP